VSLTAGTRFGPYEILTPLGAGGMGEVYRARDTRLDRAVAIKVLPAHLAADSHFRERFDREARAIAALSHPHIRALYDIGHENGVDFLVLELLQGESLADRIAKGALHLDQVLRYAIEIADALDKAHRAGIVHRDLKPGNVMVTGGGAKLLDFGLARAGAAAAGDPCGATGPTEAPLTGVGTILGTLHYMAPEQLEGKDADARTDIFAFGAVVYEMATGQKAFGGQNQASVIAAILDHDPPPIAATQPAAPPALDHIVKVCLAKQRDDRWQNAGDIVRELTWVASGSGLTSGVQPVTARSRIRLPSPAALAAAVVLGMLAAITVMAPMTFRSAPSVEIRSLIDVAPADRLQGSDADMVDPDGRPSRSAFALAPDGRSMVFGAVRGNRQQLYLRHLDQIDATPIANTDDAQNPFFSPDGRWVGYWSGGELKKVPLGGGPPVTLCKFPEPPYGASWGSDDRIVLGRLRGGLWQVAAAGSMPEPLTTLDKTQGEVSHRLPHVMPGAEAVVFTVTRNRFPKWNETRIAVHSRRTGANKLVVEGGADARYVSSGHLVYVREGTIMAMPFDPGRQEATGGAVGLSDVMQAAYNPASRSDSGAAQLSISDTGALAYLPGGVVPDVERSLVWVDRTGHVDPLPIPSRPYAQPRLSPDGRRFVVFTQQANEDLWMFDFERRTLARLTSEGRNATPVWTPDGEKIVYRAAIAGPDNLFWLSSDGSGAPERLMASELNVVPAAWVPDGTALAFYALREDFGSVEPSIWLLPLDGDRRPKPLFGTRFYEAGVDFSPDGRLVAYSSDESGRPEVYVRPYPGPGPRRQVSNEGGQSPVWSRDGHELFFERPTRSALFGSQELTMMTVPVETQPALRFGTAKLLFAGTYVLTSPARSYDVSPDGRRFLMVQQKDMVPAAVRHIVLVQQWIEELRRRVPVK